MIERINISYFKAIAAGKNLNLGDLSVFIGNNGSGKSSAIEALKTLQDAVLHGLSPALNQWGGYERIRSHQAVERTATGKITKAHQVGIDISCRVEGRLYRYEVLFAVTASGDFYYVSKERLRMGEDTIFELIESDTAQFTSKVRFVMAIGHSNGKNIWTHDTTEFPAGALFLSQLKQRYTLPNFYAMADYIKGWQFLNLNSHIMGVPAVQDRANPTPRLSPDGSNIALILRRLADQPEKLNALVDKMRFVLPYMSDIRPQFVDEIERKVFLEMKEQGVSVAIPGWLLSTGTLRILTLLVAMQEAPPVLFIEEIENGLDPRTIGLLLSEIQSFIGETGQQVIATTHSPYFLDLLDLRHIIVAEKEPQHGTTFHRVNNDQSLQRWKEKFSPGQLYTMGKLNQ
jgi:predicted ATPase